MARIDRSTLGAVFLQKPVISGYCGPIALLLGDQEDLPKGTVDCLCAVNLRFQIRVVANEVTARNVDDDKRIPLFSKGRFQSGGKKRRSFERIIEK